MKKTPAKTSLGGGAGVTPTPVNLQFADLAVGFGTNGVTTANSLDPASSVYSTRGMTALEVRNDLLMAAGYEINGSLSGIRIWPVDARSASAGKAPSQYINSGQSFSLSVPGCKQLVDPLLPSSQPFLKQSDLPTVSGVIEWNPLLTPRLMVLNGFVWVSTQVTFNSKSAVVLQRFAVTNRSYDAASDCVLVSDASADLSPVGLVNVSSNNQLSLAVPVMSRIGSNRKFLVFHFDAVRMNALNLFNPSSLNGFNALGADLVGPSQLEFFGTSGLNFAVMRFGVNASSAFIDSQWLVPISNNNMNIPPNVSVSAAALSVDRHWVWSGKRGSEAVIGKVKSDADPTKVQIDSLFGMGGFSVFFGASVDSVGVPSSGVNGILLPFNVILPDPRQGFGRILRFSNQGALLTNWGSAGMRLNGHRADSDVSSTFWWGGSHILTTGGRKSPDLSTEMYLTEVVGN